MALRRALLDGAPLHIWELDDDIEQSTIANYCLAPRTRLENASISIKWWREILRTHLWPRKVWTKSTPKKYRSYRPLDFRHGKYGPKIVHSSLVSDPDNVVEEHPFLVLLLLEEGLESVANIEDTNRLRTGAEHRHILQVLADIFCQVA